MPPASRTRTSSPIYDRGSADGSYYIVMEYVEGRTLKELIVSRGPCPVPIAISYTRQILAALRYAHRNGIIHRDIKPHNVIVDREGRVQVADFGIARAGASQMTEAGSIIGTAQYLSPEQARGAPVDESSDLYSTGIVLYELLTGTVPFTGETPVEIAMKHLSQPPEPPSEHRHEIPDDLDSRRPARARQGAGRPLSVSAARWTATSSSSRAASRSGRRRRMPPRWCSRAPARSSRPPRRASSGARSTTAAPSATAPTRPRSRASAPGGRGCSGSARSSRSGSPPGSSTTTSPTSWRPRSPSRSASTRAWRS